MVRCEQPVSEYLCLGTHLPHVGRRAENKSIGLLKRVVNFLHVVFDETSLIPLFAAITALARFDIKIVEIP